MAITDGGIALGGCAAICFSRFARVCSSLLRGGDGVGWFFCAALSGLDEVLRWSGLRLGPWFRWRCEAGRGLGCPYGGVSPLLAV
jgi:hypothetical protein